MIRKFQRIATIGAIGAIGAGLALAASLPAGASTGPRLTSQEQAGYAASGARFRFVETTFTLPDATKFASEVGGLGVSVQLISSENTWMVLSFNTTTASGVYAASYANEFNAGQSIGASGALGANGWAKAGDSVTLSIYYDRAGNDHLTAVDNTTGEAHFRAVAIPTTSYTHARLGAEFGATPSSTAPYTAPAAETHLVALTGIHLTTYSGHRSGLVSWWERQQVLMVNNGVTQVEPHNVFALGRSFNIFMEPLPQ
jgi:hypothetical protein